MADLDKIAKIHDLLSAAEASLKSAKQLLGESFGTAGRNEKKKYAEKAADRPLASLSTSGRVIEGIFDGQTMIDSKGNSFPVPANYASKSKLVPGDVLKLTITEDGKFLYKQIGPIERKTVVGPLVYNNNQYQILGNNKAYNVLLASVTYFRAEVGDEVTLIIPAKEDSDWGAIEAVLPKFDEPDERKNDDDEEESEKKVSKKKSRMEMEDE